LNIQDYITQVTQRAMPKSPMARVRLLAKELAEGATEELWGTTFSIYYQTEGENVDKVFSNRSENLDQYLVARWQRMPPWFALLEKNGYLVMSTQSRFGVDFDIAKASFDLLEEVGESTAFISYRRADSSAFALLVLARMKAEGLDAFLDLSITPGDNWHTHIKEQVQKRDYMILVLGQDTLTSEVVKQEIEWALEAGATLIPIWHNRFKYESNQWNLSARVHNALSNTHTIRVLEESALAYNNAIVELLNRFGVTP
jgi:hypothetical protein